MLKKSEAFMKLSIIIPVYNVERYVIRCLESVAMEMDDDCELILVDDGSTDASGALCEHFSNSQDTISKRIHHVLSIIFLSLSSNP